MSDTDDIQFGDSASVLSQGSRRSRSSRASSVQSQTELLRIAEEQRRAELTARSAAINRAHELELPRRLLEMGNQRLMQQIEMSRLELERRSNQLKLQTEIDVSNARLQVLDKLDGEFLGHLPTQLLRMLQRRNHHILSGNPSQRVPPRV